MTANTWEQDMEDFSLKGALAALFSLLTAIFGGGWVWAHFSKKSDNATILEADAQKNSYEMSKTLLAQDVEEGTRSEKALREMIRKLELQLAKHEERLDSLEEERRMNLATISRLDTEVVSKDTRLAALEIHIDRMIKVMENHNIHESIIDAFRR